MTSNFSNFVLLAKSIVLQTITFEIGDLDNKVGVLNKKLENKSFLKNAPKLIVQREKSSLQKCIIELKKLNSIINSIKN